MTDDAELMLAAKESLGRTHARLRMPPVLTKEPARSDRALRRRDSAENLFDALDWFVATARRA
jgi:hypothetical protein